MNDYKSLAELLNAEHVWNLVFCFNVSNGNRSVVGGFNKTPLATNMSTNFSFYFCVISLKKKKYKFVNK